MSEAARIVVAVRYDAENGDRSPREWRDPNGWDVRQVIDSLQGAGLVPCEVPHEVVVTVTEWSGTSYGQPAYALGTAAPARWCLVGRGWDETVAAVERALTPASDDG